MNTMNIFYYECERGSTERKMTMQYAVALKLFDSNEVRQVVANSIIGRNANIDDTNISAIKGVYKRYCEKIGYTFNDDEICNMLLAIVYEVNVFYRMSSKMKDVHGLRGGTSYLKEIEAVANCNMDIFNKVIECF